MRLESLHRTWFPSALAGALLLLSPFVVFIRYQDYSLSKPETIACLAFLAATGMVIGLLMELVGQYSRVLIFSFLITLHVDIQMQQPERALALWIVFGASLAVIWFLRNQLARLGVLILMVLLVSSLFLPTGRVTSNQDITAQSEFGNPKLPIFLHIILDEQIGVEGVPVEFDQDGRHAEALRDFYLDWGFLVFGRAYSRYLNTWATIPNLCNFAAPEFRFYFCESADRRFVLTKNKYFDVMTEYGYQIHVYQTDYLDFCNDNSTANIASRFTCEQEAIKSIEDLPLSTRDKLPIILGVYSRLSDILGYLPIPQARISTLSSIALFERLRSHLLQASPGMMFVVHLLLPHSPYVFRSDCQLRDYREGWLMEHDPRFLPDQNDAASRAKRYPLYLEQVACTNKKLGELFLALAKAGKLENMAILIHGDHGSRISINQATLKHGRKPFTKADFVDVHSTLFAVKAPGIEAAYDRRILPVGSLFAAVILKGQIPPGVEWAGKQQILFKTGQAKMQPRPMPDFERELRTYEPNR
ncbi:MAG: sulfatase-like hydrolase/transferase [Candidatus Krumholzibacteria bacterium]|nr:sulfatase-like hydrolase/transferase [Candidatus Krumholzibacteria bacterium]